MDVALRIVLKVTAQAPNMTNSNPSSRITGPVMRAQGRQATLVCR